MNVLDNADVKMVFADGLIYTSNGQVLDPETKKTKGRFPDAGGDIVANQKAGRIFFFRRKDEGCLVSAYDPQKYLLVGQTVIPKVDGDPDSAQVCGDGYVFRCGGKIVTLSSNARFDRGVQVAQMVAGIFPPAWKPQRKLPGRGWGDSVDLGCGKRTDELMQNATG